MAKTVSNRTSTRTTVSNGATRTSARLATLPGAPTATTAAPLGSIHAAVEDDEEHDEEQPRDSEGRPGSVFVSVMPHSSSAVLAFPKTSTPLPAPPPPAVPLSLSLPTTTMTPLESSLGMSANNNASRRQQHTRPVLSDSDPFGFLYAESFIDECKKNGLLTVAPAAQPTTALPFSPARLLAQSPLAQSPASPMDRDASEKENNAALMDTGSMHAEPVLSRRSNTAPLSERNSPASPRPGTKAGKTGRTGKTDRSERAKSEGAEKTGSATRQSARRRLTQATTEPGVVSSPAEKRASLRQQLLSSSRQLRESQVQGQRGSSSTSSSFAFEDSDEGGESDGNDDSGSDAESHSSEAGPRSAASAGMKRKSAGGGKSKSTQSKVGRGQHQTAQYSAKQSSEARSSLDVIRKQIEEADQFELEVA